MSGPRADRARTWRTDLQRRYRRLHKQHAPEVLYAYAFSAGARAPTSADFPGYALVPATEAIIADFRRAHPRELTDRKHDILAGRVDHPSESCWFIRDPDGQWVGYCHVAWEDTLNARIRHRVRVGAEEAYFFDDYVVKRGRGQRLHTFSIARRLELAAERGVTRGLTTISRPNRASVAAFTKFGLVRTHILLYLPDLRRTLTIRSVRPRTVTAPSRPPSPTTR